MTAGSSTASRRTCWCSRATRTCAGSRARSTSTSAGAARRWARTRAPKRLRYKPLVRSSCHRGQTTARVRSHARAAPADRRASLRPPCCGSSTPRIAISTPLREPRRRCAGAGPRRRARGVRARLRARVERDAHALVIAGDLFERSEVGPAALHHALAQLARVREAGIAVILASGNHDPGRALAPLAQAGLHARPDARAGHGRALRTPTARCSGTSSRSGTPARPRAPTSPR